MPNAQELINSGININNMTLMKAHKRIMYLTGDQIMGTLSVSKGAKISNISGHTISTTLPAVFVGGNVDTHLDKLSISGGVSGVSFGANNYSCILSNSRISGAESIGVLVDTATAKISDSIVIKNNRVLSKNGDCIRISKSKRCVVEGNTVGAVSPTPTNINFGIVVDTDAVGTTVKNNHCLGFATSTASTKSCYHLGSSTNYTAVRLFQGNTAEGVYNSLQTGCPRPIYKIDIISNIENKTTMGAAAPTGGSWTIGDKCIRQNPSPGGNLGWICTADGMPGTWKSYGSIAI